VSSTGFITKKGVNFLLSILPDNCFTSVTTDLKRYYGIVKFDEFLLTPLGFWGYLYIYLVNEHSFYCMVIPRQDS
jgi:hypothetical protein